YTLALMNKTLQLLALGLSAAFSGCGSGSVATVSPPVPPPPAAPEQRADQLVSQMTLDETTTKVSWLAVSGTTLKGLTPLFPFGYGLSYSSFTIANAKLTPGTIPASGFQVDFDLQDTGTRSGAVVPQVCLSMPP